MFETAGIAMLRNSQSLMAQVIVQPPGVNPPEQTALLFSGPKFFVALIAGIVLAFAFQFLLTNLSIAAGISYLGHQGSSDDDSEGSSLGSTIRKIGFGVGLWTLISVCIALFIACFLAVRLSLLYSPVLGAIVGLVIWGAYFSVLVWLSSTTFGSLIGSVLNTVTSGFQTIVNTATAALGGKAVSDRMVATAEAAAAAMHRELTAGIDPDNLRDTLEDYLETLRPAELDVKSIRQEFETLLRDPQLQSLGDSDVVKNINRQTFVDLIRSRTDLSPREVNRLASELEAAWKQVIGEQKKPADMVGELRDYLASALPERLRSNELSSKLDKLIAVTSSKSQNGNGSKQDDTLVNQALQFATTTLTGVVLGRQDLSDLDVETILSKLRTATNKAGEQADKLVSQTSNKTPELSGSIIRSDVENYLLNSYSWQMKPEKIEQDFREVLHDPDADPGTVRQQLESLNRLYFVQLLKQRGDLTQLKIAAIADQLERIRREEFQKAKIAEVREQAEDVYSRVVNYLRTASPTTLSSKNLQLNFAELLDDPDAEPEILAQVLKHLDNATLSRILTQRNDASMTPLEMEQIISQLSQGRDRAIEKVEQRLASDKSQMQALQMRIESYLRHTDKAELDPEGIKRDLQTLRQDPQLGLIALRYRFEQFDRDTLVQLLTQRRDLSEEQVNQILDQFESTWDRVVHTPQALASQAKEQVKAQYDEVSSRLADYLRSTNLEELNPEGIQQDLSRLFNDPKGGSIALKRRLSQVDRETLVRLLSQRGDLSEAEVNQYIDQVQSAIRQMVRTPRRIASRTKAQVQDFQSTLENYLRNTDKEELNPAGIKRDLQLLLQDPRVGWGSLSDRLSKFDRSTLVALLAQRPDISEAEANQIVDEMQAVRDQFVEQVRDVQRRIQSVIDGIFGRIRRYLNSLERPELNYDGIRRDIRKLFYDPQAGFEGLRDRLSHFNRDTLVAILASRDDISEADANRIIDQIEGARINALQRAERLQQAAQERLEDVKARAKKQAEETRKAAEVAAWWLFGTALTSAFVSALAGAMGVVG
ncbi:MAG: MFS transporter [Nostocaceae cyanobacterium]|nr:MFS transporter [Nostocaceae cyanobacterium]